MQATHSRPPGLTCEGIQAFLSVVEEQSRAAGYDVKMVALKNDPVADMATVSAVLSEREVDGVVIGEIFRMNPMLQPLFEHMLNTIHATQPKHTKITFGVPVLEKFLAILKKL